MLIPSPKIPPQEHLEWRSASCLGTVGEPWLCHPPAPGQSCSATRLWKRACVRRSRFSLIICGFSVKGPKHSQFWETWRARGLRSFPYFRSFAVVLEVCSTVVSLFCFAVCIAFQKQRVCIHTQNRRFMLLFCFADEETKVGKLRLHGWLLSGWAEPRSSHFKLCLSSPSLPQIPCF